MAVFHLISLVFIFTLSNSRSTNASDGEKEEYPDYTTESYYEDYYDDYGAPIEYANFPKCCPENQAYDLNFMKCMDISPSDFDYTRIEPNEVGQRQVDIT